MRRVLAASLIALTLAACGGEPVEPKAVREATADEVAEAKAYLAANYTPLPSGWAFSEIPFGESAHLRIGHAPSDAPKGTIIFVPGYTSSPELASDFLAAWTDMGFEVASVDLPGQGGSVRREDDYQKPYTGDFSVFGQSVAAAVEHIDRVRMSEGPLIVAGDSFGGHSILRGAADTGLPQADGLFVLVPAVQPELEAPKFLVKWAIGDQVKRGKGAQYMDGMGAWSADDFAAYDVTRCGNREDRNYINTALAITKPELRVGGPTNEWGLGMVTSGENLMKNKALRQFGRPVQMVTAGLDVIVKNGPAEKLCTRHMTTCELSRIEEATHCVYLEDEPTQAKVHDALMILSERLARAN